jgi:hypothetical protein
LIHKIEDFTANDKFLLSDTKDHLPLVFNNIGRRTLKPECNEIHVFVEIMVRAIKLITFIG